MTDGRTTPREVVTALARLELPDPPLDRALAAIEELVEAAVRGRRRTRFADAARICAVGTQLLSATAEGVLDDPSLNFQCGDVDGDVADAYGMRARRVNVNNPIYGVAPVVAPVYRNDAQQQVADVMQILAPQAQAQAASSRAAELRELGRSLESAKGRTRRAIRGRITLI